MVSTLLCTLVVAVGWRAAPPVPKLVVLLVVDQMRSDYVDKLRGRWTGGFHRLLTEGAWFRQANYPYFNTVTCAGHATIGTGALPSAHGMVLNGWYDRTVKKEVACVADSATTIVSYGTPLPGSSESAWRMRLPTLADEMRAQLSPASRAIGFP
jgi:predicted AlkP superfamily pyrophosphatase or phosphodiesterase